MLADNVKLGCSTNEVNILLEYLRQAFLLTLIWDMQFNSDDSQHVYLGPVFAPPVVMPDETSDLLSVPLVKQTTDLWVIVNSKFKFSLDNSCSLVWNTGSKS